MSAPDYFIDYDAHGDPWVWRENGDRPVQVIDLAVLSRDPGGSALLDLIRAAVEGEVREEWGVRLPGSPVITTSCECDDCVSAASVRRTVITGAWEEER